MKNKRVLLTLMAAAVLGSTGIAAAQGPGAGGAATIPEADMRPSMGSKTSNSAMRQGASGTTTGMSTRRSEQDNPNGSPNTPPISREGPGGDPSRNNDAPK
jgi:hypothetical protein